MFKKENSKFYSCGWLFYWIPDSKETVGGAKSGESDGLQQWQLERLMSGDTHQIRLSQVPASMLKFDHTTKRKTPCTSDGVSKFQVIYQGWPITWNSITTLSLTPIDRSQKQHNGSTKYEFDVRWYKHQVLFIWKETYLYSTHSSTRIIPRMLKMWFLITPASQPDPRGRHSSHVHTHTH